MDKQKTAWGAPVSILIGLIVWIPFLYVLYLDNNVYYGRLEYVGVLMVSLSSCLSIFGVLLGMLAVFDSNEDKFLSIFGFLLSLAWYLMIFILWIMNRPA